MMTDAELERMVKNLQTAFADVSTFYERQKTDHGPYAAYRAESCESAAQLAEVSQAYLAASREQQRREEDKPAQLGKPASAKLTHSGNQ